MEAPYLNIAIELRTWTDWANAALVLFAMRFIGISSYRVGEAFFRWTTGNSKK